MFAGNDNVGLFFFSFVYFQTPVTAAGSWFALSQSAGVLGMAATTKAAVGAVAGGITYVASLFV